MFKKQDLERDRQITAYEKGEKIDQETEHIMQKITQQLF